MKRLLGTVAGIGVALAATAAAANLFDDAAPAFGIIWAIFCFAAVRACSGRAARLVWWNLGAVCLVWVGFELLVPEPAPEREQTFEPDIPFYVPDPVLGIRPQPNTQFHSRLRYAGSIVYDVTYTFDERGLRISPPDPPGSDPPCIVFFGCSFTFGEGVEDQETMPYRVGDSVRGRYGVRNFGFMGYGPHHMLAAIEGGLLDKIGCRPQHAVFSTMEHHVVRASGNWWWDQSGPRYVLQDTWSVVRQGSFADRSISAHARDWLQHNSSLFAAFREAGDRSVEDYALYFSILATAKRELEQRYRGIAFHVLVWDRAGDPEAYRKGWENSSLEVHPVSRVLPGVRNEDPTLYLPHDPHPTKDSQAAVANYVVHQILGRDLRSANQTAPLDRFEEVLGQ